MDIPGWLSLVEGVWLRREAGNLPADSLVVEIGCAYGRSTSFLAEGCKKSMARLTTVDHFLGSPGEKAHDQFPEDMERVFWANMRAFGVDDVIDLWVMDSHAAAGKWSADNGRTISMLFIDGAHDNTYNDAMAWIPLVMPGGIVAFHDAVNAGWPHVSETVSRISTAFYRLDAPGSIWAGQLKGEVEFGNK